jgi:hypothetical protein
MFSAVAASLFSVRPAQGFTVTIHQVGSNVVANGSGAFNLMGLTLIGPGGDGLPLVAANTGLIQIGAAPHQNLDAYRGFTGPTSFGVGTLFLANIGSGDFVSIQQFQFFTLPFSVSPLGGEIGGLFVPTGYVSGTALSDSMTFNNATFASLGVTPGTYVWSWGAGANQNFTLIIGGAGVPDGG